MGLSCVCTSSLLLAGRPAVVVGAVVLGYLLWPWVVAVVLGMLCVEEVIGINWSVVVSAWTSCIFFCIVRSGMTIGTTDGNYPSFNGRLIHDQQHLLIIYFISLNILIDFVSSLTSDRIDARLRKIVYQTHVLT